MSKPAIKSLGVWGSLTSLWAIVDFMRNIPPDLITDLTDTWQLILAAVAAIVALFGRFKAKLPIAGLLFSKKDKKVNRSFGMFIALCLVLILNYKLSYAEDYRVISVSPTVGTSAYTAGDELGTVMTFSGVTTADYAKAEIVGARLIDLAGQGANVTLHLFSASPATDSSDNAALDFTDASLANYLCSIDFDVHDVFADNSVSQALADSCVFELAQSATAIYGQLESEGTPTYAASTDVTVAIWVKQRRVQP